MNNNLLNNNFKPNLPSQKLVALEEKKQQLLALMPIINRRKFIIPIIALLTLGGFCEDALALVDLKYDPVFNLTIALFLVYTALAVGTHYYPKNSITLTLLLYVPLVLLSLFVADTGILLTLSYLAVKVMIGSQLAQSLQAILTFERILSELRSMNFPEDALTKMKKLI